MKSYRFVKLTTFVLMAVSAISLAATGFLIGNQVKNGRNLAQAEDCPGMPNPTLTKDGTKIIFSLDGNATGQKVYYIVNLTLPDGVYHDRAIQGTIENLANPKSGSYDIASQGSLSGNVVVDYVVWTEDNVCVIRKTENIYIGTPTLSSCADYKNLQVAIPEGMKKKKDEQIKFNITNPNENYDVYVKVELSNGASDYKTINSLFKLDKYSEKTITMTPGSNPDRIDQYGQRTIRVSAYNNDQESCSVSEKTVTFEYIPNSGQSDDGNFTATGPGENPAIGNTVITPSVNTTIGGVVARILGFLVLIIGALAFISICVSGIQYITSAGDSAKAEKAKKTLLYSVLGMVLAVLSFTLLWIVTNELQK